MCVSSHHTPSALALSRRRGERSGQGQSRPFHLGSTVSYFGQGKQTDLASGQGGLSRVALPGQGIALDRRGRDGKPLIDAGHYFQPRKLGQLQTERCHGNRGNGSQAEGFSCQLTQPHFSTQPHKSTQTKTQICTLSFQHLIDQQAFVSVMSLSILSQLLLQEMLLTFVSPSFGCSTVGLTTAHYLIPSRQAQLNMKI